MAETRSSRGWDPLQSLRELLDRAERSLNEVLAERSGGDRRNELRSLLSRVVLDAQRLHWRIWGRAFETINLPTRTDVIRMGKTLAQIEQRLTQLENALRGAARQPDRPAGRAIEGERERRPTAQTATDRPRPSRTRRPPSERAAEEAR
jgi:hypothetical protein